MYIKKLKKKVDLLTEHCEYITKKSKDYWLERNFYKSKYDNLFELVFNEKVHQILAICVHQGEEYVIYTKNFIHFYESSFYSHYDSYFAMDFVMDHLSCSNFKQAARAEIEIRDKNLQIVTLNAFRSRCGYGGKLFEYIEKYARANGIEKIFGTVDVNTHIGLENLIRFYEKQGCTVYEGKNGLKFKKELDKKEL